MLTKCIFGHTFNPTIVHILLLVTGLALAWNFLIVFHLNETISHYILIIQLAVSKIVPLAIILISFVASFAYPFVYLVNDLPNHVCFPAFS